MVEYSSCVEIAMTLPTQKNSSVRSGQPSRLCNFARYLYLSENPGSFFLIFADARDGEIG